MKQIVFSALTVAALLLNSCGGNKTELKSDKDSVSYAIGLDVGMTFQRQGIDVTPEAFVQGLKDAADTSGQRMLTDEQIQGVMLAFQQKMMAKQQEKMMQQSGAAIAEGEKFLAENKTKSGVTTTASGLQYKVIKVGKGKKPTAADRIRMHYKGSLINGMVFENSYESGQPATLSVTDVFPGLSEALVMMPVGSTWELYVPSSLGYGNAGSGPIPPGSTLIFQVELLGIVK